MDQEATVIAAAPLIRRRQSSHSVFLFCLTLVLVLASGFLYLSHNRFSYQCHIDEPGKVAQIQSGARNFHHPLLMLNVTQAAFALSRMDPTPQNVVWVGRTVTALFSIAMILAFSYAAFLTAGPLAAALCGAFLLGSPLLLELSHYFKEDPAMMMGISFSFLAIALYQRTPDVGRLLFLALAAALAASGKHLGIAILPFCLYPLFRQGGGARHGWLFLAAFAGAYALINYQTVVHFARFLGGLDQEVFYVKRGGVIPSEHLSRWQPLHKYFSLLLENAPFPLFWFAGFGVWTWTQRQPEKTPFGHAALFALLIFVVLAAVPKTAARYLLPVICTFCFVAAVGAARLYEQRGRAWKIVGFALPLVLALGAAAHRSSEIYQGLRDDSRGHMADWIKSHLPKDAVIAQDEDGLLVSLSDPLSGSPYQVPQKLYAAGVDIKAASLAALRANGVQYFVVVHKNYALSRRKQAASAALNIADPLSLELAHCKKIWTWSQKKVRVANVSPALALYQLPPQTP